MNDDLIRSKFEYWAAPQGLRLHRRDMAGSTRLGQYCSDNTQLAFEAFRAALSHAAGQEVDDSLEIERDDEYDREYIPMPGGWEVQTKGRGSTFRLCGPTDDDRLPIPNSPYLHETLTRMARDVNAASRREPAVARSEAAPPTTSAEVWRDGNGQWELIPSGFLIDGPHGTAMVLDRAFIEPKIEALCENNGDDPGDYTATELYMKAWRGREV